MDEQVKLFLQYGSFGLIAFLVFMFVWKIYPGMQAEHRAEREAAMLGFQATITKLVDEFKEEAVQCRDERMATAREAAEERDKDRMARHELANAVQKMLEGK